MSRSRDAFSRCLLLPLMAAILLGGCGGGGEVSSGGSPGDGNPVVTPPGVPGGSPGDGNPVVTPPGGPAVACNRVHIVDLSQDQSSSRSCANPTTRESIADCLESEIRNALPEACLASFDVFVPGTAAEHGAWKQFNSMFSRDTGRAYLSLQYRDAVYVEGLLNVFDAASYDQGVIDAATSLDLLLYALDSRFGGDDVRVFGHSKGAHAVALVAEDPEFRAMKFFAFAQPGRTEVDISARDDIRAGKRGRAGWIDKLTDNLVGITWQNDEVKFYTGSGTNGLQMPEKWSYPGYVWQDSHNGANPLVFRIDHHNNYGGTYTDGRSGNQWRDGEGSIEQQYPYCATGNSFFNSKPECDKSQVSYLPYFWGDGDCRSKAFEIMNDGSPGDSHYIGYSGPRAAGCTEATGTLSAEYRLVYRINIGDLNDNDCRYDMEIFFGGLGGRPDGGRISVSTTSRSDTGWLTKRGTLRLPPHMTIRVTAGMTDISGVIRDCGGVSIAQSEGYIQALEVTFTHPGTGARITRTIIGLKEGSTAFPWPISLDMQNNVAWWEADPADAWHLYYAPTHDALMVKGKTDGGVGGRFYKWLHLLD